MDTTTRMERLMSEAQSTAASRITYLLWSNRHNAYWRPNAAGYTDTETDAGRYSEAEALAYVLRSAQCGILTQVTCMVAAPDNWVSVSA